MPMTIGQVVKDLRNAAGVSQPELVRMSRGKLSLGWLASLETNRIANPPQAKLEIVASLLRTTVTEIYSRAGIVDVDTTDNDDPQDIQRLAALYNSLPSYLKPVALKIIRDLASAESVIDGDARAETKSKKAA